MAAWGAALGLATESIKGGFNLAAIDKQREAQAERAAQQDNNYKTFFDPTYTPPASNAPMILGITMLGLVLIVLLKR